MKKYLSIITILLGIGLNTYSQSIREVKTYYDYFNTKIKAIEQVTDDNKLHGIQKYYYENGDLRDQLNFKFDKKEGIQKVFFHNGKIKIIVNYKDGKRNGELKEYQYDKDKYYLYVKQIFEDEKVIESTKYYPNGNKLEHSVLNGLCNQWYDNGTKGVEYTNVNGIATGRVIMWTEKGIKKSEGEYVNSKKHNDWNIYNVKGEIIRKEGFYNGQLAGEWKVYYDKDWKITDDLSAAAYYRIIDYSSSAFVSALNKRNSDIGKVPEDTYNYSNTNFVFKTTDYFISGQKQWDGYVEDNNGEGVPFAERFIVEVGKGTYYYPNGNIEQEGFRRHNGEKYNDAASYPEDIWKSYDESGTLIKTETYKRGELNGIATLFYPNGNKKREGFYITDKFKGNLMTILDGYMKFYYENGQLKKEGYKYTSVYPSKENPDELKTLSYNKGLWKRYSENGTLIQAYYFEKGKDILEMAETEINEQASINSSMDFEKLKPLFVDKHSKYKMFHYGNIIDGFKNISSDNQYAFGEIKKEADKLIETSITKMKNCKGKNCLINTDAIITKIYNRLNDLKEDKHIILSLKTLNEWGIERVLKIED